MSFGFVLPEQTERIFNKYYKVFTENHYVLFKPTWERLYRDYAKY